MFSRQLNTFHKTLKIVLSGPFGGQFVFDKEYGRAIILFMCHCLCNNALYELNEFTVHILAGNPEEGVRIVGHSTGTDYFYCRW